MTSEARHSKPLRRDAAASRARILEAAATVFARDGFDAPLSEVAATAKVGVATLSRHFSRRELAEFVAQEQMAAHVRYAEEALTRPSPEAMFEYLEALVERRRIDRSVCHAITLELPDSTEITDLRKRLRRLQTELIGIGQQGGAVRPGVVPQDLILALEALQGVVESTKGDAAWRRLFVVLKAGLSPDAEAVALSDPPELTDLLQPATAPRRGRPVSPIHPPA